MKKGMKNSSFNWLLVVILGVVLAILIAYPLYSLVSRAFISKGHLSINNFIKIYTDPKTYDVLKNTLFVSVISTLIATTLGSFFAWLVTRTDMPGSKWIRSSFMFKFFIPPFVNAMAWLQMIGPSGYINRLYMHYTNSADPLFVIYGKWGIILVMSISFSLIFLLMCNSFEKMDPALEEAGQISGASTFRVLKDITLPIMTPAILSAMLLSFIANIANFGIPAVMGFGSRFYVLTTRIYRLLGQGFLIHDAMGLAVAMSMLLVLIAVAVLFLVKTKLKGRSYEVISGKSSQPKRVELGKFRYLAMIFSILIIVLTIVLPLISMLLTSLTRAYGLMPTFDNLTFRNYRYVLFDLDMSRRGIRNSIILALSSASVITLIGLAISYLNVRTKLRGRNLLDFMATIPQSIPGTVFALGMILAWGRKFFGAYSIYNTLIIIFVAYCARFLSISVRTITPALQQINVSLEEAARISGASSGRVIRDIVFPVIRPAIMGSWFLVLMPTLRELTISVLLWSTGNETIGVAVYNLQEGGNDLAACSLAVIMIMVLFGLNFALKKITHGKYGY